MATATQQNRALSEVVGYLREYGFTLQEVTDFAANLPGEFEEVERRERQQQNEAIIRRVREMVA